MSLNRIVFLGHNKARKTQAIESLCATSLLQNTDFQYGMIDFGEEFQLQLADITDPNLISELHQREGENNIGFILLIDNTDENYLKHFVTILESAKPYIDRSGIAIGLVNSKSNHGQLESINKRVRDLGIKAPVFEIAPENREDVVMLVKALLISIDYQLSTVH